MGLLERARAAGGGEQRSSIDMWLTDFLIPSTFAFNGHAYGVGGVQTTLAGSRVKEIAQSLPGYAGALRSSPPAFAAQVVRSLVLSQARFTFRFRPYGPQARRMVGTDALLPLEQPWPGGTTADLLGRMEWHAGLAGNAYVTNRGGNGKRLRILRPDWVGILYGSEQNPEQAALALDGEVVAYTYTVGGPFSGTDVKILLPHEVAHWAPLPDPEGGGIGMSWLTPALRDIQADNSATDHKLQFFRSAATPNMVVKGLTAATQKQLDAIIDAMENRHAGLGNAYKTMYLTGGADATVVGSNFQEMDFRALQDGGETRVSLLSRVPAALLGISEGLKGSSLNAGNFAMARRVFADTWAFPALQSAAGALAPLVKVPAGCELWTDTQDIPLFREDAADAANIEQTKSTTVTGYINSGFTPKSAVEAVARQDITLLEHTGLVSVQLQPPGDVLPGNTPAPGQPALPTASTRPRALEPLVVEVHNHLPELPEAPAPVVHVHNRYEIDSTTHIADGAVEVTVQAPAPARRARVRRRIERDDRGEITAVTEEEA